MRRPRLKAPKSHPVAYYHCVSRIVGREFLLGDEEKEQFRHYMRLYERLYGLRIISYCLMSNHFHLLVEVPQRPDAEELPDDEKLVKHVRQSLGEEAASALRWELEHYRSQGNKRGAEELRKRWFDRMWNISTYMKVLKQRFTQWYNKKHGRKGTLWEDRFRSVLVEGKGAALKTMAAYIDLNPVRAGICQDPKDYRWCSYGEAVAGGKQTRQALKWLMGNDIQTFDTQESLRRYRCHLYGVPENQKEQQNELSKENRGGEAEIYRKKIDRQKALEVLEKGGNLKRSEYLRCRVRYFCDGVALGSKEFVEGVFRESRELFSAKRQSGGHPLRGLEKPAEKNQRLYNLRQLQKSVVT